MARPKPAYRRKLTIRYLRHALAGATLGRSALLRNAFAFYPQAIAPEDAADVIVRHEVMRVPTGFDAEQAAFVVERCRAYDTHPGSYAGEPDAECVGLTTLTRDCEFLGHTGTMLSRRHGRIIMHAGLTSWNYSKPGLLRRLPPIAGTAMVLPRTRNYYHTLLDSICRVTATAAQSDGPLTVVIPSAEPPLYAAFCRLLGERVPGLTVRDLPGHARLPVETGLWSIRHFDNFEWAAVDRHIADEVGSVFRVAYGVAPTRRRRIFFSRGGTAIRRLDNEAALFAIAERRGFERFVATSDNHAEQVRVFSEAEAVVGVHGAGLANLLFAPAGARVLELFPANFTKSTYLWLSRRLGLDYGWLVGTAGNYDQQFSVDETAFAAALDRLTA